MIAVRKAVRPENRVKARSMAPQNRCTGLDLPMNRVPNSLNTRSISTRASQKRCTAWPRHVSGRQALMRDRTGAPRLPEPGPRAETTAGVGVAEATRRARDGRHR